MRKIFIFLVLSWHLLYAQSVSEGWNMLGVSEHTSSSEFITNSGEYLYWYKNNEWQIATQNAVKTIDAGSGLWLYSTTARSIDVPSKSASFVYLESGEWGFVSPTNGTWNLKDAFATTQIAWRFANGQWRVYSAEDISHGFGTLETLSMGDGFWIKSVHNAYMGHVPIMIDNGSFATIKKPSSVINDEQELKIEAKSTYDMRFGLEQGNMEDFSVLLEIVKNNSSTVYIKIDVNSAANRNFDNPYVSVKSSMSSAGGIVIEKPFLQKDTQESYLQINFDKMVGYLLKMSGFETVKSRLQDSGSYKITVYAKNLDIIGSEKLSQDTTIDAYNFPAQSSKLSGTIVIE